MLMTLSALLLVTKCARLTDREEALLRPPMGWRAWYAAPAHGLKDPTQAFVTDSMDAMVDRSRLVDGKPTSLADLGYTRASVDGRYLACTPSTATHCKYDCGGVNGSYHDRSGAPVLNSSNFPDVAAMVEHAHALNLTAGWYTNNFQASNCEAGWSKTDALHQLHMHGEAEWLARMKFDELKVDSGGNFNNMSAWEQVLNATGRQIALENCHQGGEPPNASWCPFQQWRTSGDPKVVGWQREMLDTAQLLHRARRGCWAYPGYAIYGASATNNRNFNDTRTAFGAHVIVSSPLILSIDITDPATGTGCPSCPNQLDLYWEIVSNREALAVNQQWAGSAGSLIRKWNPASENRSSPLYVWGVACNSSSVQEWQAVAGNTTGAEPGTSKTSEAQQVGVWSADDNGELRLWSGGQTLCPQYDHQMTTLQLRPCNSSSPDQGFRFNATSGAIQHNSFSHGNSHASEVCVDVWAESEKESPRLGPYVTLTACDAGGSSTSRAGRRWNLTASGELMSQMGAQLRHARRTQQHPPADASVVANGPCLAAQHGSPNIFGPMQLWSKPQPQHSAAVFIQATGSTWGNNNFEYSVASFELAEIPGLPATTSRVHVRDIWNHVDLPDAENTISTDPIAPGDSRFYLLTPIVAEQ